jgi:hypothetical protein
MSNVSTCSLFIESVLVWKGTCVRAIGDMFAARRVTGRSKRAHTREARGCEQWTGNTTTADRRAATRPRAPGGERDTLTLSRLCAPALRGGPAVPLNP